MTILAAILFAFAPMVATPTHTLDESAIATAPAVRLDPPCDRDDVECIIRDVWPDNLEERALHIAYRESRWQPGVINRNRDATGLFQIMWSVHRRWLCPEMAVCAQSMLLDARTNAEAALALYYRAGSFGPWSTS
jgi:hypothetical protein